MYGFQPSNSTTISARDACRTPCIGGMQIDWDVLPLSLPTVYSCVYMSILLVAVLVSGSVLLAFMFPRSASLSLIAMSSSNTSVSYTINSSITIAMQVMPSHPVSFPYLTSVTGIRSVLPVDSGPHPKQQFLPYGGEGADNISLQFQHNSWCLHTRCLLH